MWSNAQQNNEFLHGIVTDVGGILCQSIQHSILWSILLADVSRLVQCSILTFN